MPQTRQEERNELLEILQVQTQCRCLDRCRKQPQNLGQVLPFGLTAALYGKITVARGRVQQSNFNDYRMLRMNETPQIEVHLIQSGEAPGGIGETGTTAAPPALCNALFAATGVRLRRLPIDRDVLSGKKPS